MVTAHRKDKYITRNSSHFKIINGSMEGADESSDEEIIHHQQQMHNLKSRNQTWILQDIIHYVSKVITFWYTIINWWTETIILCVPFQEHMKGRSV